MKYYIRTVANLDYDDLPGFNPFYEANKNFFQSKQVAFNYYACEFSSGNTDIIKHENLVRELMGEENEEKRMIGVGV